MRIGYAKLGRTIAFDPSKWGVSGGDDEAPLLVKDLALRNPQHEFMMVGRTAPDDPVSFGYPGNILNPWKDPKLIASWAAMKLAHGRSGLLDESQRALVKWFDTETLPWYRDLDGLIIWLGQHGTSNMWIPQIGSGWELTTNPQDSFLYYSSLIIRGLNVWRSKDPLVREEINLIADNRNYAKARDIMWPLRHPILGQYDFERVGKHERFNRVGNTDFMEDFHAHWDNESDHVWVSPDRYVYSRLEICGIMPWHVDIHYDETFESRQHFGLFINEARAYVANARLPILQDWVLPLNPAFIHGKWSAPSLSTLGVSISTAPAEVYYDKIRSVKCTFTTPSSGSGWATTKPWQAFGAGTVCFFHPAYDSQNHILRDADPYLMRVLRVETPQQLRDRVAFLSNNENEWRTIIRLQHAHFEKAVNEGRHYRMIEERLGL